MKSFSKTTLTFLISCFISVSVCSAVPLPPEMSLEKTGLSIEIEWTPVTDANGYRLYYTPYPYTGPESIGSVDVGEETEVYSTLWEGASYYVAVRAYDESGESRYSNSELFLLGPYTSDHVEGTPELTIETDALEVSTSWTSIPEATGYRLYYTPYPFTDINTIGNIDMGNSTDADFILGNGAAFYVAVAAEENGNESDYSNIELLLTGNPVPEWQNSGYEDLDADGYSINEGDCNDSDADISPDSTEVCGDEIDQDCDGSDAVCPPIDPVPEDRTYTIVDTGVTTFYSDFEVVSATVAGNAFYGQDANYTGNSPSYTDNDDGTITDNNTGLMWQQDVGEKMTTAEAEQYTTSLSLGGHTDWRVPTIKELYSLIQFTGQVAGEGAITPFIDTSYFEQPLGDTSLGEREIDAQTWSATEYVGTTMNSDHTVFGVNFVDGRIKGYPTFNRSTREQNKMYFRMVRGNSQYGLNRFVDNMDGTISDLATGLMWQKADDGISRNWQESLAYSENLELAGYNDWRLPNAKELQSIVDYTRSPQTTDSPAIDPFFETTEISDPDGNPGQYPYFWTSTTHLDGANPYSGAAYIAFGEGQGEMNGILMDVHGAGCQRSDPKDGAMDDYPDFHGPQGDVRYVFNYVRAVR